MLRSDRFGSPPRRDDPPIPSHSYSSSSDESYARIGSGLSRSESGTSRTHYEDFAVPSPKALMNQYNARGSLDWDHAPEHSPSRQPRRATAGILQDPMAMQLLLETAVGDSAAFDVMSFDELEELKREEAAISQRIPNLRRDLQLEMKLRDAAQSFNRVSDPHQARGGGPGAMSSDEYAVSAKKCEDLSTEIYNLERRSMSLADRRLKHTAAVLQIDYEQRTGQAEFEKVNGGEGGWASGFNLQSFAPGGLADTFDGIMDIPGGDPHTDATINQLWNVMSNHDAQRGVQQNDDFSLENFSLKVQGLCDRAANLEDQMKQQDFGQLQEAHDQHVATKKKLQDSQSELFEARAGLDQMKQELEFVKHQNDFNANERAAQATKELQEKHDADHADLHGEVARLQTEVTIARAELETAYGSRAERAADISENPQFKAKVEALESRNDDLQKELRDLVTEHETLTRQGVDSERDREGLESTVDQLREKLEGLEIKLSEERVRHMGRSDSDSVSTPGSTAGTDSRSLAVMRNEFKKMMRDARAEQFKVLRAEQEERRKLEAALRQLRKEQNITSPGMSPATLSPPPLPRSNLRQNVTAS